MTFLDLRKKYFGEQQLMLMKHILNAFPENVKIKMKKKSHKLKVIWKRTATTHMDNELHKALRLKDLYKQREQLAAKNLLLLPKLHPFCARMTKIIFL